MRIIEANESILNAISTYPNTRSSGEALNMIAEKGVGYGDLEVTSPTPLDNYKYDFLGAQISTYLKIGEKLSEVYLIDSQFRMYIKKLVLQFEDPRIESSVENYPLTTLTGARFATDSMITDGEEYKTTEVNIGPVGGPAENIAAQELLDDEKFPIDREIYLDHYIWSLNAYYLKACEAMGITPKSFKDRHIVYVENDGWFPGSFKLVDALKKAGMNITIAPKEALLYREDKNVLNLLDDDKEIPVDQILLYFHLQEDIEPGSEKNRGDIIKSLANQAVIADTSLFPLIVLASKSISGLISQMANEPNGLLAQRLGINKDDLLKIADMFPKTYHWRRNFFTEYNLDSQSKFSLSEFFSENELVIKSSRTDSYGGKGVFGAEHRGKNSYNEFYESLKKEVELTLSKNIDPKALRFLKNLAFINEFKIFLSKNELIDSDVNTVLEVLFQEEPGALGDQKYEEFNLRLEDLEKIRNVITKIKYSQFVDSEDVDVFLNDYIDLLILDNHGRIKHDTYKKIKDAIISHIASEMILPYVIQKKVITSRSDELRVSGFIGENVENHTQLYSGIRISGKPHSKMKLLLYVPRNLYNKADDRTNVEESKLLEVEATAPLESTVLELSTLPQDRKYGDVLVLMCGAGRHARYLSKNAENVVAVDISSEFIREAKNTSHEDDNIKYEVADVRNYFRETDLNNKFDLVALLGLGLSYLKPEEQLLLLKDINQSLRQKGTVVFDIVDLNKFGELLDLQGPVGSRFIQDKDRALERLTRREIKEAPTRDDYYAIHDTTSYITDNRYETMSDNNIFYVPLPSELPKLLYEMDYTHIKIDPIIDTRYVGMLRYRWIVTAQK